MTMWKQPSTYLIILCLISHCAYALDDLDDGIALDEPIDDKLQLNRNIDFIKRNAIAKARREADGSSIGCSGAGNQTFGPGTNLKGAIIINLSNNKGTSSVCLDK